MGLSTYIHVAYYSKGFMAKSQVETKLQSKEEQKQKKENKYKVYQISSFGIMKNYSPAKKRE